MNITDTVMQTTTDSLSRKEMEKQMAEFNMTNIETPELDLISLVNENNMDADEEMMAAVDHPAYYAEGRKYEPIDVIEDWKLDFSLGSAVKYIARAGKKDDTVQDLTKAIWYINREIHNLQAAAALDEN